jgi:hypothetical protein
MAYQGKARLDGTAKQLSALGELPAVLQQAVNASKVNLKAIDKWIETRMKQELGFEDDILTGMISNKLASGVPTVNVKSLLVELSGFIHHEAAMKFLLDLWPLLVDAQSHADGLPRALLVGSEEDKKTYVIQPQRRNRKRSKSPPKRPRARSR